MFQYFINEVLLFKYKNANFVLQQKARVLSGMTIILITITLCLYSYFFLYDPGLIILIPTTIALLCLCCVLYLIKLGYYHISVQILLFIVLTASWSVIFADNQDLLIKSDTIAFVLGGFSLCALIVEKQKAIILSYWVACMVALVFLCYQLKIMYGLTDLLVFEYFLDNTIGLFFIAVVSYQVVSINNSALQKANDSILLAEEQANKNRDLTLSLEQKVILRTEELSRNNLELQKEIKEKQIVETRLRAAQKKLVESAHKAGMAEIATDTLHNVGNVLNSVKTSAHMIEENLKLKTQVGFSKACNLIREHQDQLGVFIQENPRGKKLIDYLLILDEEFKDVFDNIENDVERLQKKINTIAEVIISQQTYAGTNTYLEKLNMVEIIEDALFIAPDFFLEGQIKIVKNYNPIPAIPLQKTKLLHVMVNLFKNAAQAIQMSGKSNGKIEISVYEAEEMVKLDISDNGVGITEENLSRIFSHGFTTKSNGFGFGLHSCANYIHEMGGTILAESGGPGKGTSFKMQFPTV